MLKRGPTVASFTKEVNPRLAKRPLKTNGRLANRGLTSLVKEATVWSLNVPQYREELKGNTMLSPLLKHESKECLV